VAEEADGQSVLSRERVLERDRISFFSGRRKFTLEELFEPYGGEVNPSDSLKDRSEREDKRVCCIWRLVLEINPSFLGGM
jgi:hypothetical protein